MSSPINLGVSESNGTQDADAENNVRHINNPTIIIARQDDHCNVSKSDKTDPNPVDIVITEKNVTKNSIEDVSYKEKAQKLPKKKPIIINDSHVDVASYLRSEFSASDKLPKYKDIDMMEYSRKYIEQTSLIARIIRYFRRKHRNVFMKNTTVHFQSFGSENIPDSKVTMEYEPETRNATVKGMFVILMLLHLFTWTCSFTLWITPTREIFITHGHLICIGPFSVYFLLVLCVTCFQLFRNTCCSCFATITAFLCMSTGTASIAGYISTRIFNFSFISLFGTDLICVLLGCYQFDYMSKRLYFIAIGSGAIFLSIIIPLMEIFLTPMVFYWGDDSFPQETIVGYVLCVIFTLGSLAVIVAELHLLLGGEWVEMGEDDYIFGGFLLYVSLIDFPIRICRKYGLFGEKGEGEGDDDEE